MPSKEYKDDYPDLGETVDRIVRQEFGGCHPAKDDPCVLRARVNDGWIEVFLVGKWRNVGSAGTLRPPSSMLRGRAIERIRWNTGSTFSDKKIVLLFEKEVKSGEV